VAMSTPDFVKAAPYGAYIFLGLMCVIGAAYVYFFVPETSGRTLDEIDALFGDTSGRSKLEGEIMHGAMSDVGLLNFIGAEKGSPLNGSQEGHGHAMNEKSHVEHRDGVRA
jgi:hypothetical protein